MQVTRPLRRLCARKTLPTSSLGGGKNSLTAYATMLQPTSLFPGSHGSRTTCPPVALMPEEGPSE